MSLLIVEHAGSRKSVPLDGKVWIGRDAECQIIINHPIVSRQHAWVEPHGAEGALVGDNSSRNGVMMAGEKLTQPRELADGEIFHIGPATIAYHARDPEIDIEAPSVDAGEVAGIIFACECGARLWAPRGASGSSTICPKCRKSVKAPGEVPPPPSRHQICGVCQWKIQPGEESTACPACGVAYHAECWRENKGCAAYGCSQVSVLAEKEAAPADVDAAPAIDPSFTKLAEPTEPSHIEVPLLAGAVIASLLGVVAFGAPAFIIGAIATGYALVRRGRRRYLLATAAVIGLIGTVGGLLASLYWWMQLSPKELLGL